MHSQHEYNYKDRHGIKHLHHQNLDGKENSAQSSAQLAHLMDSFTGRLATVSTYIVDHLTCFSISIFLYSYHWPLARVISESQDL